MDMQTALLVWLVDKVGGSVEIPRQELVEMDRNCGLHVYHQADPNVVVIKTNKPAIVLDGSIADTGNSA